MRTMRGGPWALWFLLSSAACSSSEGSGEPSDAATGNDSIAPVSDTNGSPIDTVSPPPADSGPPVAVVTYGSKYEGGQFHLGPVDWDETAFHNACAPGTKYATPIRAMEGELLAGLWNGIPNTAGYCDACIQVTTAKGKSALLRVVTYGDTTSNSIDVSPAAYALLNSDEFPRAMTWQFAKCHDTGKVVYEFQTGSNEWWTSLWVRNARIPLAKVEVKSKNHGSYITMARGGDGTLTDASGFGAGAFTIQLTSIDGQTYSDSFEWPSAGIAGQTLTGAGNFP